MLSQFHFLRHSSQTDWPGREPVNPLLEADD
jgi:hypothetical protein